MNILACSFFVVFAIISGIVATTPAAFADHTEVTVEPIADSSELGSCGGDTGVECLVPDTATVDVGGKVIFSNTSPAKHAFVSGSITDDTVGLVFKTGLLKSGESYSWTADTVGEHPYFCYLHPWEDGTIIVQEKEEKMQDDVVDDDAVNGCLIATATYGSELAPQVQQLRELRDNTILSTESGTSFMTGFNQFYYSFSPAVADLERESPVFKQVVKLALTPMLSSLSLLNHIEIDSEEEMLGYGISLILLNIGMYIGIPVFGILKLYQFRRN